MFKSNKTLLIIMPSWDQEHDGHQDCQHLSHSTDFKLQQSCKTGDNLHCEKGGKGQIT